jgi:hypothetical protein
MQTVMYAKGALIPLKRLWFDSTNRRTQGALALGVGQPPSSLLFKHGEGTWIENANHYIPVLDQFRSYAHNITMVPYLICLNETFQYFMDYEALTCYESHRNYTVYDEQGDVVSYPSMHYIQGMQYAYEAISDLLHVSRGVEF